MPSNTALPTNVHYGTIVGQFVASVADTPLDDDYLPDSKPMGGSVVFTPSVPYVKNISNEANPVTIVKTPITAVLDDEGFLCTQSIDPATNSYKRGVTLVATDDPNLNPTDWTWLVEYRLSSDGRAVAGPAKHNIIVPMGSTIDLTVESPVASSPGNAILRGPVGPANVLSVGEVTVGAPDVEITGESPEQVINFTLPVTEFEIGTVVASENTVVPEAEASITGEYPKQKLNLTLPRGVRGPSGITTVQHGTDGTVARPVTDGLVYWVGTARPTNALPYDWWYEV